MIFLLSLLLVVFSFPSFAMKRTPEVFEKEKAQIAALQKYVQTNPSNLVGARTALAALKARHVYKEVLRAAFPEHYKDTIYFYDDLHYGLHTLGGIAFRVQRLSPHEETRKEQMARNEHLRVGFPYSVVLPWGIWRDNDMDWALSGKVSEKALDEARLALFTRVHVEPMSLEQVTLSDWPRDRVPKHILEYYRANPMEYRITEIDGEPVEGATAIEGYLNDKYSITNMKLWQEGFDNAVREWTELKRIFDPSEQPRL